jgi:hypothetical protein
LKVHLQESMSVRDRGQRTLMLLGEGCLTGAWGNLRTTPNLDDTSQQSSGEQAIRSLLEERIASVLNADTLHGIPATPSTDHGPQLPLPPADRDHWPQGATDLRRAEEGLIP